MAQVSIQYELEAGAMMKIGRRPTQTDSELAAAARNGDRAAFGDLHERFAPMVHGILLARVPVHDADDLVQEVFLQVMRTLPGLRDPAAIGPWLARIARNAAAQFYRRKRPLVALPENLPARERPADDHDIRHEALQILTMIRSLPDAYRETLILRLVEGLSGPVIARRTGMTPGSVRVNLHRGMKLLREQLGQEDSP